MGITMKTLYAMVTRNCNLSCPHCDIKVSGPDDFNHDIFFDRLINFEGHKVIFGGEPSLFPERIKEMAPYCDSISTNLLHFTDELFEIYKNLGIATSWNPARFPTSKEYQTWLSNVKRLKDNKPMLLITLTPDLLSYKNFKKLLKDEFDGHFDSIVFEQLIDHTKDQSFYDAVDLWLCDLHDFWINNMTTPCYPFERQNGWQFECSENWTMLPDGTMRYGCPNFPKNYQGIRPDCYQCEYVSECRPCQLQKHCSCPKQLMEKLNAPGFI